MKQFLLSIILSLIFSAGFTQQNELRRKAFWAFSSTVVNDGIKILRIDSGGTIESLGLVVSDIIIEINGKNIKTDLCGYENYTRQAREGDPISIKFLRGKEVLSAEGTVKGLRKIASENYSVIYGYILSKKGKLRTIVKEPKTPGRHPAVLFIPEFSCWSVESYLYGNAAALSDDWVKKGFAVVYVERTGLGDNENTPSCRSSDLLSDFENYAAGYTFMKKLRSADTSQLFIFGHGMGGIVAAKLANEFNPKGTVVFGTSFRPWNEVWKERLRLHGYWSNRDLRLSENKLSDVSRVFYAFFIDRVSPEQIINNISTQKIPPADILKSYMAYDAKDQTILGRHWRYWQQLDSIDLPALWSSAKGYILSLYGDKDYEGYSRTDHEMIAETVNTYHPGAASFAAVTDLSHNFDSIRLSIPRYLQSAGAKGIFHAGFSNYIAEWLHETAVRPEYIRPEIVIPKDASLVDFKQLSTIITKNAASAYDKVKAIIDWANKNLSWTATDYVNRTAAEIICKRGGNCNEEKKVVEAMLGELGIPMRTIREINIQPESERRKNDAAKLIESKGNSYSVFGLRHNDHVWIEYYDEQKEKWEPADPTTGLIGLEEWLTSRIGFGQRPMHTILSTKDMLVPIAIFTVNKNTYTVEESLSEKYLIEGFNTVYKNKLKELPVWKEWIKCIRFINGKVKDAFSGDTNLHLYEEDIKHVKEVYEELRKEYHAVK